MKHKLQNLLEAPGGSPRTRQAFKHTLHRLSRVSPLKLSEAKDGWVQVLY